MLPHYDYRWCLYDIASLNQKKKKMRRSIHSEKIQLISSALNHTGQKKLWLQLMLEHVLVVLGSRIAIIQLFWAADSTIHFKSHWERWKK